MSSIFLFLTACGGGGSGGSTNNSSPISIGDGVTTSSILCDYKGSGTTVTKLADNSSQPFQFAWTCGSTFRTLVSNGIPNHTVGTFPNPNNPNTIAPYAVNFSAPISPLLDMVKPVPIVGYALNGVKFDPNTGGGCINNAASTATQGAGQPSVGTPCTYLGGGDWSLEAIVPNSPPKQAKPFKPKIVSPQPSKTKKTSAQEIQRHKVQAKTLRSKPKTTSVPSSSASASIGKNQSKRVLHNPNSVANTQRQLDPIAFDPMIKKLTN